MAIPIFGKYTDNILNGASVGGTAPLPTYSLNTLLTSNPSDRVLFAGGSASITFTLPGALKGEVLAIPMTNATALTVMSSGGLSVSPAIPALQDDGLPGTIVLDMSALAGTTASSWTFNFSGAPGNLVLGGMIGIYTKNDLSALPARGVNWDFKVRQTHYMDEVPNEYGTPLIKDYLTKMRQIEAIVHGTFAHVALILAWFEANHGRALPSLFWPRPEVLDGYVGRWQKTYEEVSLTSKHRTIKIVYDEWPKGEPA